MEKNNMLSKIHMNCSKMYDKQRPIKAKLEHSWFHMQNNYKNKKHFIMPTIFFFTFTIFWSSFFDFQHHKINTTSIEDLNGDPSGHLRWCCFRFHSSWRGHQPQVSYHEIWYVMIDKIVTNRNSTFTHHFLNNKANSNNLRLSTTLYIGGPPPGKRGLCF